MSTAYFLNILSLERKCKTTIFINMSGIHVDHLCWSDVTDVFRCQLFQQRRLAAVVQSQKEYSHLLVWCAL